MKTYSDADAGKAMNLNPSKQELCECAKSCECDKSSSTEEPWPFKEKAGSVFPAKRRLVKRRVVDLVVQLFSVSSD